jgi:hypothetical protein
MSKATNSFSDKKNTTASPFMVSIPSNGIDSNRMIIINSYQTLKITNLNFKIRDFECLVGIS